MLADKLVYAERILSAQLYGSLELIFPESLGEIEHGLPDIAVHADDHLAGDLVHVDLIENLCGLVLLVVLILKETAHQVPHRLLGFRVVLVILTGEDILHRDDHLSIAPLPYLDLAYAGAALEVKSADLALGQLHQAEKKTLGVDTKIMTDSREDVRLDNFLGDYFLVL